MSDEQTTEETTDHGVETEVAAAPGVRVPNVRPGAISGLDHVLLDPTAAAEAEADAPAEREDAPSVDDELERIRGIEDDDERRDAADVLWKRETRDDPAADHSELAEGIRLSVYGEDQSAEDIANSDGPDLPTPEGEVATDEDGLVPPVDDEQALGVVVEGDLAAADQDENASSDDAPEGDKTDEQDGDPETSA